ncbi:MAG TPA: ATP-binding protein, partial [Polyangiaceae bacterium]|nr:ATP-binding protein [Polyangiaceae bacterium]
PTPRIVGVARDVTDDRELEDELRQAQKLEALGALASSVAHDFGNLLQGVIGCLNIALSSNSSDRSRDYLRQAVMALKGGATLVSQLMRFSRKEPTQARPIGMDAAIFGCEKLLQRLVGDHIQVRIEAHAPQSLLVADPVQIEQILMNLAANARDAMPQGGQLLIRTEEVHKPNASGLQLPFVQLEVRDLGCGMDQQTQARVFDPFFTTKSAGKGTGLGLSTVRAVTRSLGGEVAVDSEPGQGTVFTFHFPTASAPIANDGAFQIGRRFAGRVLLVEDDRKARRSVRRALEELGFEVVEAGDAGEALSLADASLGLLITDVALPEVSGPKIREALAERYPNLKALYISAHPAPYLMQTGLLQKSDALLQKPFDVHDLAFQLAELCETADSRVTRTDGARSEVTRSEATRSEATRSEARAT